MALKLGQFGVLPVPAFARATVWRPHHPEHNAADCPHPAEFAAARCPILMVGSRPPILDKMHDPPSARGELLGIAGIVNRVFNGVLQPPRRPCRRWTVENKPPGQGSCLPRPHPAPQSPNGKRQPIQTSTRAPAHPHIVGSEPELSSTCCRLSSAPTEKDREWGHCRLSQAPYPFINSIHQQPGVIA